MLTIRRADEADLQRYFDWANDEVVRRNAFNMEPISWETHTKWFSSRLKDSATLLFVIESDGEPVGQVRFELCEDTAEIGYSLASVFRGRGLGSEMLNLAFGALAAGSDRSLSLVARVKEGNIASNKVFNKLGFDVQERDGEEGVIVYTRSLLTRQSGELEVKEHGIGDGDS